MRKIHGIEAPGMLSVRNDKKRVLCTYPCQEETVMKAKRVAARTHRILGEEVDFKHEHEEKISEGKTALVFMNDATAVRQLIELKGNAHEKYSTIIIDAYERTLKTDSLLGILKNVYGKHKSLKVVMLAAESALPILMNYFVAAVKPPSVSTPEAQEQSNSADDPPSGTSSNDAAEKPESTGNAEDEC